MLMRILPTVLKMKAPLSFLHTRTPALTCLIKTFVSSQKLSQLEIAASRGMKKTIEDHQKSQKTKIRSSAKQSNEKRPAWLDNIHHSLIDTVVMPPKKAYPFKLSQEALRATSTTDLTSFAHSIKHVDKETMKIIVALWQRLDSMTVEEILKTADIFYMNGISVPWYSSALITYVWEMDDLDSFTPLQLIRLVFHLKNHGSAPPALFLAVEKQINERLHDFDINQVAILCQLYFTGQTKIKSVLLVDKIANKLLEEFNSLNSWYLPMLMKTFRFSNYIKVSFYKELGDHIVSTNYFKNFHTLGQVMHIAFTYASVRVTHPGLFHYILMHCQRLQRKPRLKDLSKIIWACGYLSTSTPGHLQSINNILSRLRRDLKMEQIQEYPDNLAELLTGLVMLNIYPHDLFTLLFSPTVVKNLLGFKSDREKFLQLDMLNQSLSIECPHYTGCRLSGGDQKIVAEHLTDFSPEIDIDLRKPLEPALIALNDALGAQNVQSKFSLPHFKTTDIILAYDREKKCFIEPEEESLTPSTDVLNAVFGTNKIQKIAILLLSQPQTSYDGKLLGPLHCKVRQLKTLGYEVIMVDAEEALNFTCIEMKATQKKLLASISTALGCSIEGSLLNH